MREMELLRAMGDIEDELILEAEKSRGRSVSRGNTAEIVPVGKTGKKNQKRFILWGGAAAAAVLALLISSSVLRSTRLSKEARATAADYAGEVDGLYLTEDEAGMAAEEEVRETYADAGKADGERILLGNAQPPFAAAAAGEEYEEAPVEFAADAAEEDFEAEEDELFAEYASLEEAESAAGLTLTVPDSYAGSAKCIYRCLGTGLLEAIYLNESGEELFRISKESGGPGSGGEYKAYDCVRELSGNDVTVFAGGDTADGFCIAEWERGGFTYLLLSDMYLFTEEEVLEIAGIIK